MQKKPGINGEWIPVSREERNAGLRLTSAVTLGTPAAIHATVTVGAGLGKYTWLVALIFWAYGLLFWMTSAGAQLFRSKRWEWTKEALQEQRQYERGQESKRFWAFWWVRFPIGLLFLSIGMYAFLLEDFMLQWISVMFLMVGFVTPFVFMVQLVVLPLSLIVVLALLGVVTLLPTALIVMLGMIGMGAIMLVGINRRSILTAKKKLIKQPYEEVIPPEEATPADAAAEAAETAEPAANAAPEAATEAAPEEQTKT